MGRKVPQSLTIIEARAITLLASGYSQRDVAIKLGITPVTVTNWTKTERFKNARKQAIDSLYNAAMAELTDGMQLACRELLNIIENPDTPQKTKLSAINILLNHVSRNRTVDDISDVLDILDVEDESISIDTLIKTAKTREELIKAVEIKLKHEMLLHNQGKKITEDELNEAVGDLMKIIADKVNQDVLLEISEEMRNANNKLQSIKII